MKNAFYYTTTSVKIEFGYNFLQQSALSLSPNNVVINRDTHTFAPYHTTVIVDLRRHFFSSSEMVRSFLSKQLKRIKPVALSTETLLARFNHLILEGNCNKWIWTGGYIHGILPKHSCIEENNNWKTAT